MAVADEEEDEEEIHPETGDQIVAAEVAVLSHQIGRIKMGPWEKNPNPIHREKNPNPIHHPQKASPFPSHHPSDAVSSFSLPARSCHILLRV